MNYSPNSYLYWTNNVPKSAKVKECNLARPLEYFGHASRHRIDLLKDKSNLIIRQPVRCAGYIEEL